VDQGRVIDVETIMSDVVTIDEGLSLSDALTKIDTSAGGFVVDAQGRPTGLLTPEDALRALSVGSTDLSAALRGDFESANGKQTFNEVYASAGRGLPIAVLDGSKTLIGVLDPREMMEEMGRVEQLIDGFEREVFM